MPRRPVPAPPCSTSGPNLRRLYLPGLEGLKAELRKLEFLLDRFLPNLTAHLNVRTTWSRMWRADIACLRCRPRAGRWPARWPACPPGTAARARAIQGSHRASPCCAWPQQSGPRTALHARPAPAKRKEGSACPALPAVNLATTPPSCSAGCWRGAGAVRLPVAAHLLLVPLPSQFCLPHRRCDAAGGWVPLWQALVGWANFLRLALLCLAPPCPALPCPYLICPDLASCQGLGWTQALGARCLRSPCVCSLDPLCPAGVSCKCRRIGTSSCSRWQWLSWQSARATCSCKR